MHASEFATSVNALFDKVKTIICGERQDQYGNPEDNFSHIAVAWTAYLHARGFERCLSAKDVAVMMTQLKLIRMANSNTPDDSLIDAIGYLAIAGTKL